MGLHSILGKTTNSVHVSAGMMKNLAEQVADIERRLRGLKAPRPANLSQVRVFEIAESFNITLQPFGDPDDQAYFRMVIECSGTPFYSIALDDFILSPVKIVPRAALESISGNTVTRDIVAKNISGGVVNETVTVRGFALNGLTGTIERLS